MKSRKGCKGAVVQKDGRSYQALFMLEKSETEMTASVLKQDPNT